MALEMAKNIPPMILKYMEFTSQYMGYHGDTDNESMEIRPHRRCWGVIFRMALVKGYRFTWGGGHFSAKTSCF